MLVKDGSARREIKPLCLQNEKRSQRRRNRCSALMACLILNQHQHFKKVKIKNEGWASYPATIPNLAMQDIIFGEYDPSKIVDFLDIFPETTSEGVITLPLTKQANISSVKYPFCFSSPANEGDVIIDSGASVCISSHRLDFITYNKSKMKIKDLSSLNQVAGKGIIQWSIKDHRGELVTVNLLGYHIPKAEVRLLSPSNHNKY